MEIAMKEIPLYKCHKSVRALKIKYVVKHALPDPKASALDDATFEASPQFEGGHLFFEDKDFAPIPFNAEWFRKHKPQAGGYYVVYADGYTSFSPAKAFEEGYTKAKDWRVGLTIKNRLSGDVAKCVGTFPSGHLGFDCINGVLAVVRDGKCTIEYADDWITA